MCGKCAENSASVRQVCGNFCMCAASVQETLQCQNCVREVCRKNLANHKRLNFENWGHSVGESQLRVGCHIGKLGAVYNEGEK